VFSKLSLTRSVIRNFYNS